MRDETIAGFLERLAARVPAPGGGATAALHAAQSAALLAMVARYSDGARYGALLMDRVVTEADGLRDEALMLAEADAAAFGAVSEAYRLPRETPQEKATRSAAIVGALSPVPGGVGPVTTAVLLRHVTEAAAAGASAS